MTTTLLVIQHVDHEGPDQLGRLAEQRGLRLRVIRPDRGDVLPSPDQCPNSIALVLGGPMGVNERNQEGRPGCSTSWSGLPPGISHANR